MSNRLPPSGFNLPPGVTSRDIDDAVGANEPVTVCVTISGVNRRPGEVLATFLVHDFETLDPTNTEWDQEAALAKLVRGAIERPNRQQATFMGKVRREVRRWTRVRKERGLDVRVLTQVLELIDMFDQRLETEND